MLFVANHQDSLLDPVLVGSAARRKVRFLAKATLFDVPVLGALMRGLGMIPAYRAQDDAAQVRRNLEILDRAAEALVAGDCVGIFPEGKSHDLPHIEQIKGGTARIAVKAVALGGHPMLVPVGMNFERKEGFRTALWIQIGEPLDLAAFVKEHPHEKQAQRAVSTEIEARLKRVALHLDDPEMLPLLDQLEHLAPRPGLKSPGPLARLQLRKRVADAMNHFFAADRPRAEEAAAKIHAYTDELKSAGLQPRSPVMRFRRVRLTLRLLRDTLFFFAGIVPALAGLLHHAVPYVVSRKIAARFNDGRTTLALARIGFGLPLMLAMYVGVWFALSSYFLPWVAWAWTLAMPYCGFLALQKLRRLRRGGEALVAQVKLCFQPEKLRALRNRQAEVRTLVAGLAEEYARVKPREAPLELPWTWQRIGGLALRWSAVLLISLLLWTGYAHWKRTQMALAMGGMELSSVPAETLMAMLDADEAVLRRWLPDIPGKLDDAKQLAADFESGKRSWYVQEDNDALRRMLRGYVTLRTALVRMVWRYQKSDQVADESLRVRTFLCAYTAGSALATASLGFVDAFNDSEEAVKKLNEAEPAWDIPPGVFDTVRRSLCSDTNRRALQMAAETYAGISFSNLSLANDCVFHDSIRECRRRLAGADSRLSAERLEQPLRDARDEGRELIYGVQSLVSTWMGDTKLREPGKALISHDQVKELSAKLQPGDIFLERRNWYVSNAFLPGYWPHAALYVGTPDDLRALGLHHDPRVQTHWEKSCVRMRAATPAWCSNPSARAWFSLHWSTASGRPTAWRCSARGFRLTKSGKPSPKPSAMQANPTISSSTFSPQTNSSAQNCVFRAYDGSIKFPLQNIMGTRTLPAMKL